MIDARTPPATARLQRTIYLDGSAGMAGDMLLAALLDLGAPIDDVRAGLAKLDLTEAWSLETELVRRAGIQARRAIVRVDGTEADGAFSDTAFDEHGRVANDQGDASSRPNEASHAHDHPHHDVPARSYRNIRALLERSDLATKVRERALATFAVLAEAEAAVHGVPVDDVHFHEVGSTDAILDVVGCALALEALGVDTLHCTPLHVGQGHVRTEHGLLPVPAPATMLLLRDIPIYQTSVRGELTTPTGAALVRALCASFGPMPTIRVRAVGHGAGSKDFPFANVVRALLVETAQGRPSREDIVELACNIDDMTPEQVGALIDPLLGAGARDVWVEQVLMKKGRPAFVVRVLAAPDDAERLEDALLASTTTLGVRSQRLERAVLERTLVAADVAGERVMVKVGLLSGRAVKFAAEFEDARRAADALQRTVRDVMRQAEMQVQERTGAYE